MPFPPPPPPPGPPPPPSFTPPAPDGRGQLLQSIRQGTPLKKTVTNDKSAPTISGRVQGASESEGVSVGGGGNRGGAPLNGSATLGRANGLGGLFANGMPKLKPTGLDIGQTQNSQSLTSLPSATASGNNDQTRRQFNVDIKNRGPPPKPPPANQKPSMPQETGTVARARPRSTYSPVTPLPNLYQTFSTTSKDPTTSTADFQSFNTRSYDTNNTISTNDWKSHTYFKFPNINTIRLSNDVSSNKAQSTLNIPIDFSQLSSLSLNNFPNAKSPPPQFKLRSPPINMSVNNFPNAKSPPPQFKLRSPPINMSVNNFPNAKSPPPQFKLRSPPFNIPPAPLNRNFMTFPIRMHQVGTASSRPSSPLSRKPMFSISPLNTADPLSPPITPKRDEYNRFKSASSTFHSATLPPKLSIPIEFTIQRPRLTVLPIRSENSARSTSDSVLTGSGALHNRSSSTVSLAQAQGPRSHKAPPGGHGKPNVAPKPPGIKPPGRPTRTQSMRVPRSPPVAPPTGQSPFIPNQSELHRGAFYQSQDSLLHTPPPPKHNTMPSPRGAPVRPPLRPPQTRPPPPPPNKLVMTPPPPPSAPPPPPPHRVPLPPLPTVFQPTAGPAPPPPPTRHSSMRNGMPSSFSSKLEARFAERFHMREEFPPPQPFLGVTKVYNSRTAKQPAPQPPQHVQLVWSRDQHDNSSSC